MTIPQNPEIVRQAREDERDQSIIKITLLSLFAFLFSFGTIFFFVQFLEAARLPFLLLAFGGAVFALGMTLLNAVLIKNEIVVGIVALVQGFIPLALFGERIYPNPSLVLLGGSLLFGILLLLASLRGARALKQLMSVRFFQVSHIVTPRAITALLLFLSVLIYLAYFEWGALSPAAGKIFVRGFVRSAVPVVRIWLPEFSADASVEETLTVLAETQLERTLVHPDLPLPSNFTGDFNQLPPSFRAQVIDSVVKNLKEGFEQTFGAPLPMNVSISDAAYDLAAVRVERLSAGERTTLGIALAFSLFSLAKGITLFLSWVISLFAFLIFKLLVATGFAHVAEELRNREFVILS